MYGHSAGTKKTVRNNDVTATWGSTVVNAQ